MENLTNCTGYPKAEILKTLHEVIVESVIDTEIDEVRRNHVLVLDALYHFVESFD